MTHYMRTEWGARPARKGPGNLTPSRVEGIAIHWPASQKPIREHAAVCAALRSWQDYHMDTKGWSDIAYQIAVDQNGDTYQLRGLQTQSGANGDADVNERFGAMLVILAPGEQPSEKMVAAIREVVEDFRVLFPAGKAVVGHNDIRPEATACPGPILQAMIEKRAFEPAVRPVEPSRGRRVDEAIESLEQTRASGRRKRLIARALRALKQIGRPK